MRTIDRRVVGVLFSASLVVAPACWASEGSSLGVGDDQGAAAAPSDADVLAGPRAREADVPGAGTAFAPSMDGRAGDRDPRTDRWLQRVLQSMVREAPREELTIAGEQLETIQRYTREHEERIRAYRREHQDEIRELREVAGLGENDRPRQRDGAETSPEAAAAIQRLREINRGTPTNDRLKGEIWAVLTEPQRAHITSEIERLRAEADAREGADGMMMGMGDAMAPGRARDGQPPANATLNTDLKSTGDPRLDAFIERLMSLPADRRERVLTRVTEMMDRYDEVQRENRRRAQPPSMDSVDVPEGEDTPRRRGGRDRDRSGDGDV